MSKQADAAAGKRLQTSPQTSQDAVSSTAKSAFEDLVIAAKKLSSDQIVSRILIHFDEIPNLEAHIKSKNEKLEKLAIEMKEKMTKHETTHQQSLSNYTTARDRLKSQLDSSHTLVASLRAELEQRDAAMGTLKSNEASLKATIEKLRDSTKTQEEEAKKADAKTKELTARLDTSQATNEKLKDALQKQHSGLSQSEAALKRSKDEFESLTREHRSTARQLEGMQSLAVGLDNEDPMPT